MLKAGQQAPAFRTTTTDGKDVALADYAGKWLVLYFFPKAFTPGCTAETKRFRDNHDDLAALGAQVLGVSHDDHETQCDFARSTQAPFPLAADPERALSKAFGVGRALLPLDKRVTFLIDPQGVVRAVFHHEFQVSKHLDDVLLYLQKNARS